MSNAALRQRRTVPLTFSSHHKDADQHSAPTEDSSLRSGGSSSLSGGGGGATRGARKKKSEVSVSTRRLEPVRQSFLNNSDGHSGHSRNSSTSAPKTISTSDLKREMMARQQAGGERRTSSSSDPRTPSGRTHLFSIGSDQNDVSMFTAPLHKGQDGASRSSSSRRSHGEMPDLNGIEQAVEVGRLSNRSFSSEQRSNSLQKSSFAVRTPFEVDAPRGEPQNHRRSSRAVGSGRSSSPSQRSIISEPTIDQHLSEEQDAWAGIDALLETRSIDDSFCFSTTDILPKATVQAMRRQRGGLRGVDEETVWGEEEDEEDDNEDDEDSAGESRNSSKRSLESISKGSSTSSNSSRLLGHTTTRKYKSDQEAINARETRERARQARNAASGDGGLFEMFQWSEKDNVDEQRKRKGKLNSKPRKVKLLAPMRQSQHGSDTASLPSLATIRADDFSVRSGAPSVRSGAHSLDWGSTYHSKDLGSVVTENSSDEFAFESLHSSRHQKSAAAPISEESSESGSQNQNSHSRGSFANDGLTLDKGVDEYIRQIQSKLPTITEDENKGSKKGKKKKNVGFAVQDDGESSPSPTSVIQAETAFDELPSLSSLSTHGNDPDQKATMTPRQGRMAEKKEPKPSLTFLMSSIKKMTTKAIKSPRKLGDEEKYFPETVRKKDKDNRCLLNQGEDGVNWDTD